MAIYINSLKVPNGEVICNINISDADNKVQSVDVELPEGQYKFKAIIGNKHYDYSKMSLEPSIHTIEVIGQKPDYNEEIGFSVRDVNNYNNMLARRGFV